MDMGIVNAGQLAVYAEMSRNCARLARCRPQPAAGRHERLLALAENYKGQGCRPREESRWRRAVSKRLEHALVMGLRFIDPMSRSTGRRCPPLDVIEGR